VIHSDSPFCEIVSLKNYFTTEIVTMDFLLVQLHFTIRLKKIFKNKLTKESPGGNLILGLALTFKEC